MSNNDFYDGADSLRKFGINFLTGEACGLAIRGLFDLTKNGVDILKSFFGAVEFKENWNSGDKYNPHIASALIPYSCLEDLYIFAALRYGMKYVFRGDYCFGNEWTEDSIENYPTLIEGGKILHPPTKYRHPVKTWKSRVWAFNDDELYTRFTDLEGRGSFYISRTYAMMLGSSRVIPARLNNEHAFSGRVA